MATTEPLDSVESLWTWNEATANVKLVGKELNQNIRRKGSMETLVCHDMAGGYLPEESIEGYILKDSTKPFIMMHWWYIDIFTYFSHHFVTIPPTGWINQAHNHDVIILGTFITEWEAGSKVCEQFLCSEEAVQQTVEQLVRIAKFYRFDGWLINIENKIRGKYLPMLHLFLLSLTNSMRNEIGRNSRVIWYDSVTVHGKLEWQNELNEKNSKWFDITDGIFLNYPWKPKQLSKTRQRAGERYHQIYVGVDCFGRGSYVMKNKITINIGTIMNIILCGGKWNCYKAFEKVRKFDLSVALFAPGWVVEEFPSNTHLINTLRFWERLAGLVYPHRLTTLPIETNFSIGFNTTSSNNRIYNLSSAELQPFYLESNILPGNTQPYIIAPSAGDYKLFQTEFVANGTYKIFINSCDVMPELLIWINSDDSNEPTNMVFKSADTSKHVYVKLRNCLVLGIGIRVSQMTRIRNFVFSQMKGINCTEAVTNIANVNKKM